MSASRRYRRLRTRERAAWRRLRRRVRPARRVFTRVLGRAASILALLRAHAATAAAVVLRGSVLVIIASVLLASGVFAGSRLYGQFGGGQAVLSAERWAEHPAAYAPATCATCHGSEAAAIARGSHVTVRCETCHGALESHPGAASSPVKLASATSSVCRTCHTAVLGRPAAFAQVDPTTHYRNAECLRCHDPHTVAAAAPPEVTHPLKGLPACTTCHRPDGLRKVPAGHELVADEICLTCHAIDNGGR